MAKGPDAFRTISEVARELDVPQHVLRFWESRFSQVRPMKRGGGRRYYRPQDISLLKGIHRLLYNEGFTIRGVQKILREHGVQHVAGMGEAAADGRSEAVGNVVALPARQPVEGRSGDTARTGRGQRAMTALASQEMRAALQASLDELGELKAMIDRARE